MKEKNRTILLVLIFISGLMVVRSVEAQAMTIVASGADYYERPRINDLGEIVWCQYNAGEYQIMSNFRGLISHGPYNDRDPDINNHGEIIWRYGDGGQGPNGIASNIRGIVYDSTGQDPYYDTARINNLGEIVYSHYDDIWSITRGQLTNTNGNRRLAINDLGEVVTQHYSTSPIAHYDILSTTRGYITLSTTIWEWYPDINNSGEIVWQETAAGGSTDDWEIWTNIRGQITFDATDSVNPAINDLGEIVWQQWDGHDWEIYDTRPHINTFGTIVWITNDGNAIAKVQEAELVLDEDFQTWPPPDWTIVENSGTCVWESNSTTGRTNFTDGSGNCADADSDWCGSGTSMDTELWTPRVNLSRASVAILYYKTRYENFAGLDYAYVDISTDGGITWTNLLTWNEDHSVAGTINIDLTPYVGSANTVIRFHYDAPGYYWWWQLDDVKIIALQGKVTPWIPLLLLDE
ncbi:MAG: hypothetical protein P8173_17485 [Gammaproteobacteria bacterium]